MSVAICVASQVRINVCSGLAGDSHMNLLARINVALVAVFAVGAFATVYLTRNSLENSAREEALNDAGLMLDSALAVRAYTANEIAPLLTEQLKSVFLPQSVPFYAATQNFLKVREQHPQYMYKEATLNPTNPRDRAVDWEADIIQRFRNDPAAHEIQGERDTPMGPALYLARPIRAERECLTCHSLPGVAPQPVLARYGANNGFGWQVGEVIGAQLISVPLASAQRRAARLLHDTATTLIAVFVALLIAVNIVLYLLVLQPLRRTVRIADQWSTGASSAPPFPTGGGEIGALGLAFNRMRTSLEKAMKLLEP
jgi:HAMP domain-containing protein